MAKLRRALITVGCAMVASAFATLASAQPVLNPENATVEDLRALQSVEQQSITNLNGINYRLRRNFLAFGRVDARIVGGRPVVIADHGWQVALINATYDEPRRRQFCGGSLIAPRWVLTAAHCVDARTIARDPNRLAVIAGTDKYRQGGQRIRVTQIHVSPGWGRNSANPYDMDFALLHLAEDARMGEVVPIARAGASVAPGTESWVTGWGSVYAGGPGSDDLLGAEVPIVAREVCNEPNSYNNSVTEHMLCAGYRDGGLDSCQGDSGGPLTAAINGRDVLIGVVSYGEGCALALKYGVYAEVADAADWINATMQANP